MAVPRKTRGEYRPFYEALFNGKDYRQLSPEAKLCLLTLKGLSGVTGIRPWPVLAHSLAELTGLSVAKATTGVKQLVAAEWIEYEDGIVWVRRGLEFEPQMTPNNSDHRSHVQQSLLGLASSPIVHRFKAQYADFMLPPEPKGTKKKGDVRQADSHGDGQPEVQGVRQGVEQPVGLHSPSPTPTTSHTPTLTPSVSVVPVRAADGQHRTRLAVAANKGITEKFGEQPVPLRWDHPGTFAFAEALAAAGVDIDFAELALFRIASTKAPADGRPPSSLRYWESAVVDAWRSEEMQRVVATSATPGAAHGKAVDPMYFTAVREARAGDPEWQAYCRDRDITWEAAVA